MANRFTAPSNGNGIFWYSFDYGSVHVVQMSSEHEWLPGTEQYAWLQADLQSVNRTQTPWVVLTSHRMMASYCGGMLAVMCAVHNAAARGGRLHCVAAHARGT